MQEEVPLCTRRQTAFFRHDDEREVTVDDVRLGVREIVATPLLAGRPRAVGRQELAHLRRD